MSAPPARLRLFRIGLAGFVAGLVAQFLLGMAVNLFVEIPRDHPGSNPPDYLGGAARSVAWAIGSGPSIWLTLHAILGLVMVAGAFGTLARGLLFRRPWLTLTLALGALGVLVAGFGGGSFLSYHQDVSSMLMASGTGAALAAYAWAIVLAE